GWGDERVADGRAASVGVRVAVARMAAAALPYPAVRVTAESVAVGKPDPEGFLRAAADLGVDPADCVVFEDSQAGIAAGHAAGMPVVGVGERAAAYGPDFHVPDLSGVRIVATPEGGASLLHIDCERGG